MKVSKHNLVLTITRRVEFNPFDRRTMISDHYHYHSLPSNQVHRIIRSYRILELTPVVAHTRCDHLTKRTASTPDYQAGFPFECSRAQRIFKFRPLDLIRNIYWVTIEFTDTWKQTHHASNCQINHVSLFKFCVIRRNARSKHSGFTAEIPCFRSNDWWFQCDGIGRWQKNVESDQLRESKRGNRVQPPLPPPPPPPLSLPPSPKNGNIFWTGQR